MVKIAALSGKLIKVGSKLGLYPSCCCCRHPAVEWRICEGEFAYGYPSPYPNGSITDKIFNGLPCCWNPPFYYYTGYVKLQVRCKDSDPYDNNSWHTVDSWTTYGGQPTKCFEPTYPDPCCDGLLYTNCEPPTPTEPPTEPPLTIGP